jgi:ATP-dependent DNA helicase RecG
MQHTDLIEQHFRLKKPQQSALKKLGIHTIRDLLFFVPSRYEEFGEARTIENLPVGEKVVVYGKLSGLKTKKAYRKKIPLSEGWLSDGTGRIKVVWFHQPYIAKMFGEGTLVKAEGKVALRKEERYLSNPDIEIASYVPEGAGIGALFSGGENSSPTTESILPVYRETRGITSRWLYYAIQKALQADVLEGLHDPIPEEILKRYNLPRLGTALLWAHAPQKKTHAFSARKRFAFEEVFYLQLKKIQSRSIRDAEPSYQVDIDMATEAFVKRFPFTLTDAQDRAIDEIVKDMRTPHAMSRLLEGDVGSGKTAVAATTAYAVVMTRPENEEGKKQSFGNLQVAYMAPTEILAKQHFESFIELFKDLPVQIGLITGSGCKKFPSKVDPRGATKISRTQLLRWVANGEIPILIGTHALIQKGVQFKDLAYVIIDEQHRFGTNQRRLLVREKDERLPHLLSMTATPIPRTLALTIYGDLDLTFLDQLPKGRKQVVTKITTEEGQKEVYEHIRGELKAGRQAYVICPRIDEPDPDKEMALQATSAIAEAKRLKNDVFSEYTIDTLHGKMKPKEKDEVMERFLNHEIDILTATSVIEVGVNVPNATVVIIEGAERFGLAQLHQLRGRVQRSSYQSYCFLFPNTKSKHSLKRLEALRDATNGFVLAEKDLELRGAGELGGGKQWGMSDVGMEALRNIEMVEAARKEAHILIETDPDLKKYPLLKKEVQTRVEVHLE